MRKIILVLILFAGIVFTSKAQQFIASFGVQHSWGVPVHVTRVVHDHYREYNWVHATRAYRNGGMFFDLVLQRGDIFVEVSVRNDGWVSRRIVREYYPLHDHVCSNHCGYHNSYYKTYYRTCNSHHHHGHNHVVVVNNNRPHGHAYGYYKNKHHDYANVYYKEHKEHKDHRDYDDYNRNERSRNIEYRYVRERRSRFHETPKYEDRRDRDYDRHDRDHDRHKGRGNGHDKGRGEGHDKDRGEGHHSRGASYVVYRNR